MTFGQVYRALKGGSIQRSSPGGQLKTMKHSLLVEREAT